MPEASRPAFRPGGSAARRARRVLHHVALVTLAALWLLPVYVLVVSSLKTTQGVISTPIFVPSHPTLSTLSTVSKDLAGHLLNSVVVAVATAAISTFVGAMGAYYFYRVQSRINDLIFNLVVIGTFIPYQVTAVPLIRLLDALGLFNTVPGLVFSMLIFYLPTGALLMSIFILVLPRVIIESARIDGASDWTIFSRVVIPLTYPGLISTFIFILIQAWDNFFIPFMITSTPNMATASLVLLFYTGLTGTLYNYSFAAALVASLFPLIVFIFLGRYFVRGLLALGTGSKG